MINEVFQDPVDKKRIAVTALICFILLVAFCALLWGLSKQADEALDNAHAFPVYINEIMASNTLYPNRHGLFSDYIEIYNSADYAIDISRYQLSDGSNSKRYSFPSGTVIGPDEYILVFCQPDSNGADYADFGISRSGGEKLYLLTSKGVVLDEVVTAEMSGNTSMSFIDGSWVSGTQPTPGKSNIEADDSVMPSVHTEVSPLYISEIQTGNSAFPDENGLYNDWIEVYNSSDESIDISGFTLSDDLDLNKYTFPKGTVLPGKGYLVIYCSADGIEGIAPFSLRKNGGEFVLLKNSKGLVVHMLTTVPLEENESIALDLTGMWYKTLRCSPGYTNSDIGYGMYLDSIGYGMQTVKISEVMASNSVTCTDDSGRFTDWIELYNTGSTPVNLEGWYLSDNEFNPSKWTFPAVTIAPGEYLLVYCSGSADGQGLNTSFALSSDGETIVLSTPLNVVSDKLSYPAMRDDCSYAVDNVSGSAAVCTAPTPGYENSDSGYEAFCADHYSSGPLALWEIMAYNDSWLPQSDGQHYDWVEVRNVSSSPVSLSDYSITDDTDFPGLYQLPQTILQPGESIVIILSGNESMTSNRAYHAGFSLSSAEDKLYLFGPDGVVDDYVYLRDVPIGSSIGRQDDVGGFFIMSPTPGEDNSAGSRPNAPALYSAACPPVTMYRNDRRNTLYEGV